MNRSIGKKSRVPGTMITCILAGLIKLGALTFLTKWFNFWIEGRLAPGQDAPWIALIVLFSLALLACADGTHSSVRAWRGKSRLKWQIASLIGAILALLAVSGH